LMSKKHWRPSRYAYYNTACVYTHTPSTASTTIIAPSANLTAALTSLEKSTCPGLSKTLIRWIGFVDSSDRRYSNEIDEVFNVISRSCSSGRQSRYRKVPAVFYEIIPFIEISKSVSVVFPWSTWAKMQKLRNYLSHCVVGQLLKIRQMRHFTAYTE
jgi:hypothetical protein